MPWTPADAERHTEKADTPSRQRLWAQVANRQLTLASDRGEADPEAHAIRVANYVIAKAPRTS